MQHREGTKQEVKDESCDIAMLNESERPVIGCHQVQQCLVLSLRFRSEHLEVPFLSNKKKSALTCVAECVCLWYMFGQRGS